MLWTLYRHISADLAAVFALSLTGLTVILALAGVLVRVRQEGLELAQIALVFVFLLPVMLTVTLPFASLFSATLVFGRMSGNNEINACRANGISPARLLAPPAVLAVLTATATFYLTNWTIPAYTLRIEQSARENFKAGLLTRLRTRGWANMPAPGGAPGQIFADGADANADPGVIENAVILVRQGDRKSSLISARHMTLDFDPRADRVRLAMYDAWIVPFDSTPDPEAVLGMPAQVPKGAAGPGAGRQGPVSKVPPTAGKGGERTFAPRSARRVGGPSADSAEQRVEAGKMLVLIPFPSRLNFRSKYGSLDELLALRSEPILDPGVRLRLSRVLAVHQSTSGRGLLAGRFPEGEVGSYTFERRSGGTADTDDQGPVPTMHYRLSGVRAPPPTADDPARPGGGNVLLTVKDAVLETYPASYADNPPAAPSYRELRAASATVELDFSEERSSLRIRLIDCNAARVRRGDRLEEIAQVRRPNWVFDGITAVPAVHPPGPPDYRRILRESADWPSSPAMDQARAGVVEAVARIVRDVDAHLHSRFASAVCCLLFVFLGAGLGVMCRTGDYVLALAVSAIPGAVTIGVIVLGRRVLSDMNRPELGMLTIWGGPLLLLLANAVLWRRLLRH